MLRKAFKISLILAFLAVTSIGAAFGETGENYDRIELDDDFIQWTSHYERVWDGTQWVNYIWGDDGSYIFFESARMNFKLDKNTCAFSLFHPETKQHELDYEMYLTESSSRTILSNCTVDSIIPDENALEIITKRTSGTSEFKTIFELDAETVLEWTYEITNNDLLSSKTFGVEDVCKNCITKRTIGDYIILDNYYLDTKNRVHNTVKDIEQSKDIVIKYEDTPKSFLGKTIIDPTFGYTAGSILGARTTTGAGASCPGGPFVAATSGVIFIPDTAQGSACWRTAFEWDITSIPDDTYITDVDVKYDVGSASNAVNCDWYSIESDDLSAEPASNQWLDIANGTLYVDEDSGCTSNDTDVELDLGNNANADLQNNLPTNKWAVGVKFGDETRLAPTTDKDVTLSSPELQVIYQSEPPEVEITNTISNIGDAFRISGSISVLSVVPPNANITDIVIRINGTILNSNTTDHNQTAPYAISFGPFWTQITDDNIKNFTTTATVQNSNATISNETKTYQSREYAPVYFPASVISQGEVNYTFPDSGGIKVNRNDTSIPFQIECSCLDYADAFLNTTEADTWNNETSTGYLQHTCPSGTFLTACYNDDLLFITSYPANETAILVSGTAIFDQLGGFLGAPAALLVVLAIYSLGTGRNFPIISVVAMAALGVMGALGLMVLSGEIWALLMVITGLSIFGVRKFF